MKQKKPMFVLIRERSDFLYEKIYTPVYQRLSGPIATNLDAITCHVTEPDGRYGHSFPGALHDRTSPL